MTAVLALISVHAARAQTANLPTSIFLESKQNSARLNDQSVDLDLQGISIGISTSPYRHGLWAALDVLRDDSEDFNYAEARFGGHLNFINQNNLYLIGTLGVGFANARSSQLYNDVQFFTLPVGLVAGYSVMPQLSFYAGVGYKWQFEVTPNTTCNDGTSSNSVGSGTCSHHHGIYSYNDQVGDAEGMEYKLGLRYNF